MDATLPAYLPQLSMETDLHEIPSVSEIAYNRPPDPSLPDDEYWRDFDDTLHRVVRTKQLHSCGRGCLRPNRNGVLKCKRRAPWPIVSETQVEESGVCNPKRSLGYLNNFIPAISVNLRCNNDGKLLTNAADTEGLAHYIASYQTKKQGKSYNSSALFAKSFLYHEERNTYVDSLLDTQQLLLFRCMHTLNMQQELSQSMVNQYLLGYSESVKSHTYANVYWSSFYWCLIKLYPALQSQQYEVLNCMNFFLMHFDRQQDAVGLNERDGDGVEESVSIRVRNDSEIYAASQVSSVV